MAFRKSEHVCSACGASTARWSGQCASCGLWNTISEQLAPRQKQRPSASRENTGHSHPVSLADLAAEVSESKRLSTGIEEFDRVLGGGLVAGSVVLLSGDPGIGKSTLLLQASANVSRVESVVYVTAEESAGQLSIRAQRLGLSDAPIGIISATQIASILPALESPKSPGLLVIDSIQAIRDDDLNSLAGSPAQVRHCTQMLSEYARGCNCSVILIGHITKDGQLSGPKVLEHTVDVVLRFEGENQNTMRVLRGLKNRFGTIDEVGVFSMSEEGLSQVDNPSAMLLSSRESACPGATVAAIVEGRRAVLAEVQALVSAPVYGTPRRNTVGWDNPRCAMLLAVLDAHCGTDFYSRDVYIAVSGGYRITEPAADLAVAVALWSSLKQVILPLDWICFGEVSLAGGIRAVPGANARIEEANRAGFKTALVPPESREQVEKDASNKTLPTIKMQKLSSHRLLRDLLHECDRILAQ